MAFSLSRIDHLVYTAPTLSEGMDEIEDLLGMRPLIGGQHPAFGTHNALLSLGGDTYLEVIAPDPSLARPPQGYMFCIDPASPPRLATWALRTESIHELARQAYDQGLDVGRIAAGSRTKPDGSQIAWQLSDPYRLPFGGTVPFLLSWGDTVHPARSLPQVGSLHAFRIGHPDPLAVRQALAWLSVDIEVERADTARLSAAIRTPQGDVVLGC